jgi:hypothetical protein
MLCKDGTYTVRNNKLVSKKLTAGFLVGVESLQVSPRRITLPQARKLALALPVGSLLGVWRDPATGLVYVDRSVWVRSRFEAVTLARFHHELAFWDCYRSESSYVA